MSWYELFNVTWKGILLAIPIWIVYIMIKIKVLEWMKSR